MEAPLYGSVWSNATIDGEPLPKVPKHLLAWLTKDCKEAEEGTSFFNVKEGRDEHDKSGLDYAERELRRIRGDLASEKPGSDRAIILGRQELGQQERVEFWKGKIYLLDRVIEETQRGEA